MQSTNSFVFLVYAFFASHAQAWFFRLRHILFATLLSFVGFGSLANAACDAERRALASCEASAPECVLNSDCASDERCSNGVCVNRPQPTIVICVCSQRFSDVFLVANYFSGGTFLQSETLEQITSTSGNAISLLLEECRSQRLSHPTCN